MNTHHEDKLKEETALTTLINCVPASRLTEAQVSLLSNTFNHHTRPQLIEMRRLMNDPAATFRIYSEGTVTFDREGLLKAMAFRVSSKLAERLSSLLDHGVCPQALARSSLSIPLTAGSLITVK